MNKTFLYILPIFIFLSGCTVYPLARMDDSVDQTKIKEIGYGNYVEYLTTKENHTIREVELIADDYNWDNYLRLCGGLWPKGYVLVDENDMTTSSQVEFLSFLHKIDSPEEAMSYIYATNCYLSAEFGEYHQFVNKVDDGYLVSVIAYNFIGCGNHAHRQLEFLVKETGEWHLLKDTKLEWGEEYCGD